MIIVFGCLDSSYFAVLMRMVVMMMMMMLMMELWDYHNIVCCYDTSS